MKLNQKINKVRIGDCIELVKIKCGIPNLTVFDVSGVNKEKEFFEPSKQVGKDTSDYKVVPPGCFAANLMHVGRDVALPIAINRTDKNKIVSPAYTVFRFTDESELLQEYFFIYLNSHEKDRFFWFNCDSSIRDGLDWNVFCNIVIEVPSIPIQEKYVYIYKSLRDNLKCYTSNLSDLKLICDAFLDRAKNTMELKPLGDYVSRVDVRNADNKCKKVMGVSTSKDFREPTSKVNKNELSSYKICKPRQISFVQTTHNEKVFCNAMNRFDEDIVVTSVNEVFECDESKLLPEFLCLYFNRKEFDRYARFHSWGSAREVFTWDDLIKVKLPIPSIDEQKSIVAISEELIKRKEYLNELKRIISTICPILISGSLLEAKGDNPDGN